MSILASARQAVTRSVSLGVPPPWLPLDRTLQGRVFRHGLEPDAGISTGISWLDEPGTDDALVRLSGSAPRPGVPPQVTAITLRVRCPEGKVADLCWETRPRGQWGPREPEPTRLVTRAPYLLPGGPLLLGARLCGAETVELSARGADGEWRVFADLRVSPVAPHGEPFDPDVARNLLPGFPPRGTSSDLA